MFRAKGSGEVLSRDDRGSQRRAGEGELVRAADTEKTLENVDRSRCEEEQTGTGLSK